MVLRHVRGLVWMTSIVLKDTWDWLRVKVNERMGYTNEEEAVVLGGELSVGVEFD